MLKYYSKIIFDRFTVFQFTGSRRTGLKYYMQRKQALKLGCPKFRSLQNCFGTTWLRSLVILSFPPVELNLKRSKWRCPTCPATGVCPCYSTSRLTPSGTEGLIMLPKSLTSIKAMCQPSF